MAERVKFRGGLTCSCVVASLPLVEKDLQRLGLLKGPLAIFQLGYRTDVEASANTHARGGCVDLDSTPTAAEIDVWRLWGWTMQNRAPFFKFDHCHGWPYRCPHLSPSAQAQESDWDNKDAGLQGPGKVQGRWPVDPWYVALRKRKPLVEEKRGVPIMAEATDDIWINYHDDQPLVSGKPNYVHINAERHTSVVVGSSKGVDCTAVIEFGGLKDGEWVTLFWRRVWKKTGAEEIQSPDYLAKPGVPYKGGPGLSAEASYRDNLPKADTGWTACLRLMCETNSSTAFIARRQIQGWWIKP